MPCRCEPSEFEIQQIDNKKRDEERRKEKILKYYKTQADLVTRLLCIVSNVLTADQVAALPKEYHQWKQKHDEFDKKERAKEKSKKEKAKKLAEKQKIEAKNKKDREIKMLKTKLAKLEGKK